MERSSLFHTGPLSRVYISLSISAMITTLTRIADGNLYWKCLDASSWCCNNGDPAPKSQRSGHFNTTCCNMPDFMFKAPDPQQYTTADKFRLPVSTLLSSSSHPQATSNSTISASTSFVPTPTSEVHNVSSTSLTSTNLGEPIPINSSNHVGVGVGLGVGLGVGVIGLSAAVIFLVRRKKRPYEAGGQSAVELPLSSPRSELYGSQTHPEKVTYEMNA